MNIHETSTTVERPAPEVFRLLHDTDFLATHMPRLSRGEVDAPVWVRVDEQDTTLSWGSSVHHPGTVDVLPHADDPARSTLVLRLQADDDLTALLPLTAAALKTVAEGRAAA